MYKQSNDYAGDAYPASQPEHVENFNNPQHDWNPVNEYNLFYGNGQLHISEVHDHDELASHAQVPADHAGPMAVGHVHVDMGKATFEIESNIHAQGLARVFKDYCKQAGWRWGGMTDLSGEPIGTGSEFAPVKSYYFTARTENDNLIFAKSSRNLHGQLHGVVHLDGKLADVRPFKPEWWPAMKEWADDSGFLLCSGNDNVLKTIEDLETSNLYTPEWNAEDDHFMFRDPPDQRQPGGVYKCPDCDQIFPNWGIYIQHRRSEEPQGEEPEQDGKFPELDMDATMPAHWHDQPSFTEAKVAALNVMYHIAPSYAREGIEEMGLMPGGMTNPQPHNRVYLSIAPAQDYLNRFPGELDVWEVNVQGLDPQPGEDTGWEGMGEFYVSHPIGPERLRLVSGKTAASKVPSSDDLAEFRNNEECYFSAEGIENRWPHLKQEAGYYLHPSGTVHEHAWNRSKDGTIIDMTAQQLEKGHPEVVPANHPYNERYRSWQRFPDEVQAISVAQGDCPDCGEHYQGGLPVPCPSCGWTPPRTAAAGNPPNELPEVIQIPGGDNDMRNYGWRRPLIYSPTENKVWLGERGAYHYSLGSQYHDNGASYGGHHGWVSVPDAEFEAKYGDLPYGLRMRSGDDSVHHLVSQALTPYEPHARTVIKEDDDDYDDFGWTGSVKQAAPSPKDMIAAPLPFVYDIQEDTITVGQPGQHTSDIPGKFTPGGIVEGTYEPGGKVMLHTVTNMPYTVRHMLELWYYSYPQLEVKNVNLQNDDGGTTKLAHGEDVGGYLKAMLAADPTAWRAERALRAAGGSVYIVGGAVRDAILGKEPKDIDLMVTGLPPDDVDKVLRDLDGRVDLTGKDFGVFRYRDSHGEVEVALPRRERSTGVGHQDFSVQADHTMTPEEDLYRRDFTANAVAVNTATGQLVDPYNGVKDIQNGTLRTLNTKSLADDPLRTVRALVANSKHGLEPDDDTMDQMDKNAEGIRNLPRERVQAELDKLFAGKDPARAIELARDTGVLKHIFPNVDRAMGHSQNNPHHELMLGDHLVNVLKRTAEKSTDPDLRLAALLHDTGKVDSHWTECKDCGHEANGHFKPCPECGSFNTSGHFYQNGNGIGQDHETVGAEQSGDWMREMKYPNDRIKRVTHLIQHHMFPAFNSEKGARRFINRVGPEHTDDLLNLRWADQGGKSVYPTDPTMDVEKQRQLVQQAQAAKAPTSLAQLAINGRDLMAIGIKPGPEIGEILNYLVEQVVDNPELNTKDALLGIAQTWNK